MFIDQELEHGGFFGVESQSGSGLTRNDSAGFTVILRTALPQIMEEQGQMQEIFLMNFLIDGTKRPLVFQKTLSLSYRQNAVLIYGIFMILVELHEAPHPGECRDKFLEESRPVHRFQGVSQSAGRRQNLSKYLTDRRGVKQLIGHGF